MFKSYEQALNIIQEIADSFNFKNNYEVVDLLECSGRTLAFDIQSPEDMPSFDNSSMDGYALNAQATKNASTENPTHFKVISMIAAGDKKFSQTTNYISSNEPAAVEIMTGARLPDDTYFDSVVKVEDTVRNNDSIVLRNKVKVKDYVRFQGSDIKISETICRQGTVLGAEHVMLFAGLGIHQVSVFKKPKVALLSTGNELREYQTSTLEDSQIRNSSAPYLISKFKELGCEVTYFGILRDEPDRFKQIINEIDGKFDLFVSTGAVSMGRYDFIKESLESIGCSILFHKVSIRPGKPILFGVTSKKTSYFGLPGNPISSAVGLKFFIEPYLNVLYSHDFKLHETATCLNEIEKPIDLKCFFRATLTTNAAGKIEISIHKNQASNALKPLVESNVWAILEVGKEKFKPGDLITFVRY